MRWRQLHIFFAGFLILLPGIGSLSAQQRFILWSGDANCGQKGSAIEASEMIRCESLPTPRGLVSTIEHDGISLAIALVEEGNLLVLGSQIKNGRETTIEFDSDKWGAAHFRKMGDAGTNVRPLLAETSIPTRDLVRGITSGVNLDNSADSFIAGVSKRVESREVRRADGSRGRVNVVGSDPEAEQIAEGKNNSRRVIAASEQARLRQNALTKKWLAPKENTKGLVYFRRMKRAELVIFSLKIEDTVYIFRLQRRSRSVGGKPVS